MKRLLACLALIVACSHGANNDSDKAAPSASAADEHKGLVKRVHLPAAVVADAKIETKPVTTEVLATTLGLAGEVAADPDKSARVSSPVAGRIETVTFHEGAHVAKGDTLVTLRVPDLGKVRSGYASTTARAKTARANADRLKALLDQRLTSEQSYLDAKAQADALDAEARALGDQLGALGATSGGSDVLLPIKAPLDGVVITRNAVVGEPVTTERVLASIADLSDVWFLGRVFEKDLGRLHEGSPAEVTLNAYPEQQFEGTLVLLGQTIDPVARTLTARIVLKNRDNLLRVGLFGVARVGLAQCEKREPHLIVPRTAVTEITGKKVVFVREANGDFVLHDVGVGDAALGKIEILTGLREGEEVVTNGVFTLKSAALKASLADDEN